MSQENVEVVVGQYEALNARDFAAVTDVYAEEATLVLHGEIVGVTGREVVAGKEAVVEWFGDWFRQFDPDYRFAIEEVRDFGDRVFIVAIHHGRGRSSGVPVGAGSDGPPGRLGGPVIQVSQSFDEPIGVHCFCTTVGVESLGARQRRYGAMDVVVQHRITDPEKFFSMDAEEVAGGGPPGVQGRQFFPSRDQSIAVCLWEADSIDTLRDYLDPATAGASENTYFEVDRQRAVGLPEAAAAGS